MSTLDAGHALDRLVAESVMGWMRDAQGLFIDPESGARIGIAPDMDCIEDASKGDTFNPSRDIGQALMVLRRLDDLGFHWEADGQGDVVSVSLFKGNGEYYGTGATLALAICRAAVKAVASLTSTIPTK